MSTNIALAITDDDHTVTIDGLPPDLNTRQPKTVWARRGDVIVLHVPGHTIASGSPLGGQRYVHAQLLVIRKTGKRLAEFVIAFPQQGGPRG